MGQPAWFYDEMRHSGVDYSDSAQVAVYDQRHQKFRDYRKGAEAVVQLLGLRSEHTVVDMGSGTGAFTLHAVPFCKTIYAVDVSRAMLDYCRQKAAERNLRNIVFCHGGFLTYEHAADPVDAVVSTAVLHHLPDLWKFVGLLRVNRLIKPGGKFYLFDIVFPGDQKDIRKPVEGWMNSMEEKVGPEFAAEVETHVRDEFSTFDWVMEGLLTRAGFRIERTDYGDGFGAGYLCVNSG